MICAQTRFPGVSVSQVARRYDVNANQVFNWLKDPQFATSLEDVDVAHFLPVEVVDPIKSEPSTRTECGEIQIDLAGGLRLRITGAYNPEALADLIARLCE